MERLGGRFFKGTNKKKHNPTKASILKKFTPVILLATEQLNEQMKVVLIRGCCLGGCGKRRWHKTPPSPSV